MSGRQVTPVPERAPAITLKLTPSDFLYMTGAVQLDKVELLYVCMPLWK